MSLYLIDEGDGSSLYVEAPSIKNAIALWQSYVYKESEGEIKYAEPQVVALVQDDDVIRGVEF